MRACDQSANCSKKQIRFTCFIGLPSRQISRGNPTNVSYSRALVSGATLQTGSLVQLRRGMTSPWILSQPMRPNYTLSDSFPESSTAAVGRLHSMASGSFRDAKLERPVSGAELRRLLVASRPVSAGRALEKQTFSGFGERTSSVVDYSLNSTESVAMSVGSNLGN